ncbi:hypothetical protein GUJ93_ZPchr0008g13570 [Zizania palustris]|uniref:Uncharacterized protein n=1 Tax=Zizania palustris TaxID=103762 RepID=A0A8J5QWM4_ZIZPA|nr:hypothetical protein GUJ93_ZPchr0008g13570 [Zizania palustris]
MDVAAPVAAGPCPDPVAAEVTLPRRPDLSNRVRWITYPLIEAWMGLVEILGLYLEIMVGACWSTWIFMQE